MQQKNLMERAFELASDSSCRSLDDIRRQLAAEQFSNVQGHLGGAAIRKQLKALINKRGEAPGL
jgi:hypothetical protein